jgi:hypothetical protein
MKKFSLMLVIVMLCCFWQVAFADVDSRMLNTASMQNPTETQQKQITRQQDNTPVSAQADLNSQPITSFGFGDRVQAVEHYDKEAGRESILNIDPAFSLPEEGVSELTPQNPSTLIIPVNDNCADITPVPLIAGTQLTFTGDNTGASPDCPMLGPPEVWEAITTTECMDLKIDFCDTYPVFHVAFSVIVEGCPCGNLIRNVSASYVDCPEHNITMYFSALPPGTYYIPIYSGGGAIGPYIMHINGYSCPPPATNDNCADAISIGNVTDMIYTTRFATFDGPGQCITSPNIWYTYTASCTGNALVSLAGSFYDTRLAVYDGASCDPMGTLLGCNDDFGAVQSQVIFPAIAGQQYLIEVGGYQANVGNGYITTTCSPAPPNDYCTAVTPSLLTPGTPLIFNGNTAGASLDCGMDSFYPEVWEAFTIDVCMDVVIDYCGTDPVFGNVYGIINTGCPCETYLYTSSMNATECVDGNWTLHFISLQPGTYYVPILSDFEHGFYGPYTMNINGVACPQPPPNDDCGDVVPSPLVPGVTLTFAGDNTGATVDCPLLGTAEVWEAFSTTECMDVTVDYCGTDPIFSTVFITLADMCPCGSLIFSPHAGFTDCPDGNATVKFFTLPAGTYYVPVYTEAGAIGPYTMNINGVPCPPPPENDLCENAILLDIPSSTQGTTGGSDFDNAPICYISIMAPGVWYTLIGNGNFITATTCADYTDFNTTINVYEGGCNQFECVAGSGDDCALPYPHSGNSTVSFCSEIGVTYYILIQGFNGDRGEFQLDIIDGSPCEPPPPLPVCDDNSLFGQPPTGPGGMWNFMNSDAAATPDPYLCYDNFVGANGRICGIKFWGLDVYYTVGFSECSEDPMDFEIKFYEDDEGYPGTEVASYTVTASPTETGHIYGIFPLNEYVVTLDPCYMLTDGWISIQGVSVGGVPGNCWFMWSNSPDGDGLGYQNATMTGEDLAFCLIPGAGCAYVPGDINGNGSANGIDVTYGVTYLKGGTPPPDTCFDCPNAGENLLAAMDVNGSCSANGIDITFFVAYLKQLQPALLYCQSCPPVTAVTANPVERPSLMKSNGVNKTSTARGAN